MAIAWTHTTVTGNAHGVGWCTASSGVDDIDAIAAGGYVCVASSGSETETSGASAQGLFPLVAVIPVFSAGPSRWDYKLGFAVPEGITVEAHVWATYS